MKKNTIWVLEEDIGIQMVIAEILEPQYDVYFFDCLESMRAYQKNWKKSADLIISNLLACRGRLEGVIQDRPLNAKRPLTIALGPLGISLALSEDATVFFDRTLLYPFSKAQLLETVEELLDSKEWVGQTLRLLKTEKSAMKIRSHP